MVRTEQVDNIDGFVYITIDNKGKKTFEIMNMNSNNVFVDEEGFIFDNEMLALIYFYGYNIGEISCPTKYFPEASSINFKRSTKYGFGVLGVSIKYFFARLNIFKSKIFKRGAKRLDINSKLDYYYLPEN